MEPTYEIKDNQVVQVEYAETVTPISSEELKAQNANFQEKIDANNVIIAQLEALESELVVQQGEVVEEENPPQLTPEESVEDNNEGGENGGTTTQD